MRSQVLIVDMFIRGASIFGNALGSMKSPMGSSLKIPLSSRCIPNLSKEPLSAEIEAHLESTWRKRRMTELLIGFLCLDFLPKLHSRLAVDRFQCFYGAEKFSITFGVEVAAKILQWHPAQQ